MSDEKQPAVAGQVERRVSGQRCEYCDGTGDVHDRTGEWRGQCNCGAAEEMEERYLRETLAILQESYAKAAKPYIDRLVAIHARRPPAPVVMSIERLHDLWEMKLDQGMPANAKLTGDQQP